MKKLIKILLLTIYVVLLTGCDIFGETNSKVTIDYNCDGINKYGCVLDNDKLNCIITVPECKGYSFVGWYDAKTSGNEVNLDADFNDGTTIYAIWEEDGSPKKAVKENETVEVVVKPVIKKYKVSFNVNGGNGSFSPVEVKKDEIMPQISKQVPTRTGYTFMGWYDNKEYKFGNIYYNELNEPSKYFDKNKNVTLYAGWNKEVKEEPTKPEEPVQPPKEEKYKVTFDINGGSGSVPVSINVKYGSIMPQIDKQLPTRSGYTFTGWYNNKDYTKGKVYYNEKNEAAIYYDVKKNITLYAGWSKDIVILSYKIIFNSNGGSGGQVNPVMVKAGESLPKITSNPPKKAGYTFLGWYDSINEGTMYYNANGASQIKFTKSSNVTLYAHYKANKYKITFNINGGSGSVPSGVEATYGSKVPSINKNIPTRSGYTFLGWYDNRDYTKGISYYSSKNESAVIYSKEEDIVLYAGWSKNAVPTYIVTFNANGGSGGQTSSISVKKGSSMPQISKTSPAKTGYIFNGWYDSISGGTQYYNSSCDGVRNYDKSTGTTLYAQYTAITYKISYNLNGGTGNNTTSGTYDSVVTINNPSKVFTVTINSNNSGATISNMTASAKQGFIGWTAGSNLDTINARYGNTTDVINRWNSSSNKVSDKYFKNLLNASGTITLTANWKQVNVTLPSITKSGYTCGYSTNSTGSISYSSASSYTPSLTSNSITLYARCDKVKYVLGFDANGGSGGQSSQLKVAYGEAMPAISQTKPTRSGYTFTGWYDAKTNGKQYYTADLKSARNYDKTKGTVLYAGWSRQGNLKIYYLSLGRYDGYLIQGDGTTIFIDGGYPKQGKKCVEFLKEMGITKIDALIGSHLHDNHIDAHKYIIDDFEIGHVYYNDDPRTCKKRRTCTESSVNPGSLNNKLANLQVTILTPGMNVKIGNLTFDILAPMELHNDANRNSLHMILKYGSQKFYFTGDACSRVPTEIYNTYDHSIFSNITIYKHPHHGDCELPSDYINVIAPKNVIVPSTKKAKAGHAYDDVGSIVYELGEQLVNAKKIIGAGDSLRGYLLAETDGYTLKITDRRK